RLLTLALLAALGPAAAAPGNQVIQRVAGNGPTPAEFMAARDPALLVLATGIFDPAHEQLRHPLLMDRAAVSGRYAVVQLHADAALDAEALNRRGLRVLGFVPNRAFLVEAGAEARAELAADPSVRYVGDWRA